jgi:hypothetical protein
MRDRAPEISIHSGTIGHRVVPRDLLPKVTTKRVDLTPQDDS